MKALPYLLVIVIVFITSCKTDKKAELEALRGEREELNKKIELLEKEIALGDTLSNDKNTIHVSVLTVKPELFEHFIEVQGKVDGDDNVGVSAKTMGVITKIVVKEGQRVSKGQLLAQIDDEVFKKGMQEIDTQLSLATTIFEKQQKLWDQKIGSEIQYLGAKTNKEALEKRKASLREQQEMAQITSPIDGTVEEISIKVGQTVAPGLPFIRVVNFSGVKIVADVTEAYSSKIKVGNKVSVYFPDINDNAEATIDFASRYISPINRTFSVIARLANSDVDYRANMIAVLKVRDYYNEKAFKLPINYMLTDSKGNYVLQVDAANKVKKTYIKTSGSYNGMVEVVSGLTTNDQVITSGLQDLLGGETVIVVK